MTLFGSISRNSFVISLETGNDSDTQLSINFGYHGFCIPGGDVGCYNYDDNDNADLQPIDDETLLQIGQYVTYVSLGAGALALFFLSFSFVIHLSRRAYVCWGTMLGCLLPLSSFAVSSLAYGFSDCIDQNDPSSYRCRPGLGSILAFCGGMLYFVATIILCFFVRPIDVPSMIDVKSEDNEAALVQAPTLSEHEYNRDSSISSGEIPVDTESENNA